MTKRSPRPCPAGIPETLQPPGPGRHRVHRVRHLAAAGLRRVAAADGLRGGGPPPLARGAAVPSGRDERDREFTRSDVREPRPQRHRPARPRRRPCVSPFGRARRLGDRAPRRGHGAQHPRHPRRRRQPRLLRRPLPRFLHLRRRLRPARGHRAQAARARRPALVRRGAGDPRRAHARLDGLLRDPLRVLRAARRAAISACSRTARSSRAPATSSTCS